MRQSTEAREAKKFKIITPSSSVVSNDDDEGLNYSSSDNKLKKKKMKKAAAAASDRKRKNKQPDDNMDVAKSVKKVKKAASNKKRKVTKQPEAETIEAVVSTISEDARESKSSDAKRDKKTSKSKKKKRDKESRKKDGGRENVSHSDDADQKSGTLKSTSQIDNAATLFDDKDEVYEMSSGDEDETTGMKNNMDVAKSVKKVKKAASNKKRKVTKLPEAETIEAVVSTISEEARESKSSDVKRDKKTSKSKKKKRDKESRKKDSAPENVSHSDDADQKSGNLKSTSQIDNAATLFDDEDEVYEMSSGDEDETTGMKRWITKYHRARPGAEVLMENINDFLVDYAAQKEREKKEREEAAAEGGWTVVGQHKGRKKTTEAESGTTVGSVAPAAVMDKLSKKKDKQVGLNFYRFQKREAQRNEIMMLQSKFEQDKKRIQELRAARKFRPY